MIRLKLSVEDFFQLLIKELEQHQKFDDYYKFLGSPEKMNFRKTYFTQRLQYIIDNIPKPELNIWDCGCGYGTACIFLALNGIKSHGTTLEFYYDQIAERLNYWKQHGDVSLFTYDYENIFDNNQENENYDIIIVQDTLHHLEPLPQALDILNSKLSSDGSLLVVEENGNNIIQNLKLFKQRGFKRVIEIDDEKLGKKILLGNENIRGLNSWKKAFNNAGLSVDDSSVQYIRFYLPSRAARCKDSSELVLKEQAIASSFLKKYFFFGINFVASKQLE